MRRRHWLYFALGVLTLAGIAAADSLSLRNEGIEFPDGSVQTTAGQPAGTPVQDTTTVTIFDTNSCSDLTTLYTVPADKRLRIDFVSIESTALFAAADPVDVDIETHDGMSAFSFPLARLIDSQNGQSILFFEQRWSSQVTLHTAESQSVKTLACRNGTEEDHIVRILITGQLFDVLP